ncbi:MAG: hypothetical protein BWX99_02929 [Deltaproteobacteria bacterium ADurb.Bin151]|nr:MAG: hypothetical protein BWX99_02929 [Deltaproteobacteria bacterium ADurb.Bin151]
MIHRHAVDVNLSANIIDGRSLHIIGNVILVISETARLDTIISPYQPGLRRVFPLGEILENFIVGPAVEGIYCNAGLQNHIHLSGADALDLVAFINDAVFLMNRTAGQNPHHVHKFPDLVLPLGHVVVVAQDILVSDQMDIVANNPFYLVLRKADIQCDEDEVVNL